MTATLHRWPARLAVVAPALVVAGALTLLPGSAPPAVAEGLQPWSSCDALVEHYRGELTRGVGPWGLGDVGGRDVDVSMPMPASGALATAESGSAAESRSSASFDAVGNGPTGTNVQERGVDEPDTVKAAGDLLLVSARGRLQLLRAADEPELLASIAVGDANSAPAELLVDGDRVLALSGGWRGPGPMPGGAASFSTSMPVAGTGFVSVTLLDIADPTEPRVLESMELAGRYVSARLVEGAVRLVTSSSPQVPVVLPREPFGPAQHEAAQQQNERAVRELTAEQVLPGVVRRDAGGQVQQEGPAVECGDVQHASTGPAGSSTLLVTTLRPSQGLTALDSTAVTSDGDVVYASTDRLYVATSRWGGGFGGRRTVPSGEPTTELHAFDTAGPERTRYLGSGEVDGYVYGRWALSAHEGHLRVATTLQPPWDQAQQQSQQSSSSLTVLAERDGALVETGRLDGLGPDEQIYAVRYVGDLATVVTFRQTDPLYVLDLADPTAPQLRGELKIPGFSTYLHPVGDDRLLGIGQDADELGRVTGFQLSLFDLSDLATPVQVARLSLGQGWSPASEDSRAVSYDPSRSLLAIPYGDETGQSSALGVRVDGERLVEAGRLVLGNDWVERTMLHDGRVLAVTPGSVVAADADSWQRTGTAAFTG